MIRVLITMILVLFGSGCSKENDHPDPQITRTQEMGWQLLATKYDKLLEQAKETGSFTLPYKGSEHLYLVTRTSGNLFCYRDVTWPGDGDTCEFQTEFAARLARDYALQLIIQEERI